MPQTLWNTPHIKQCEKQTGQAMLRDEHSLVSFSEDFGHLMNSSPAVVCIPENINAVQSLLTYAQQHGLPVTIRGKGMSQCGQALASPGALMLSLERLNSVCEYRDGTLWVEANTTWSQVLDASLGQGMVPPVVPYNCDLTVAGVLSVGGVGASSFKYGAVTDHVEALEVITATGDIHCVDKHSPLYRACLGGQGRFGVITKACLALRPADANIRTFFLVYQDKETYFKDLKAFESRADYIESFCSPSVQGAKLTANGRQPFALWLYVLQVSVEYEDLPPSLTALYAGAKPWKCLHTQDESLASYTHRHDARFIAMKKTGLWELSHLWYECFLPGALVEAELDDILAQLPLYYATILQLVPICKHSSPSFFRLPDGDRSYALMILNQGLASALVEPCKTFIKTLDEQLLSRGGKRYLSGFLGETDAAYWQRHFERDYDDWCGLKRVYDPKGILGSVLHGR